MSAAAGAGGAATPRPPAPTLRPAAATLPPAAGAACIANRSDRATIPRMSYVRRALLAALAAFTVVFLLITSAAIDAQAPRTVQDGVFSDAQAARGQTLYAQRCAGCHGPALAGAQAPPLTGDAFASKWRMEPLSALFIKIRYTMPPNAAAAAQLTPEQGADLVAHVLKINGFPAGKTDFAAADATNSRIGWPAASGAAAATTASKYQPTGTLNQLMRGVF